MFQVWRFASPTPGQWTEDQCPRWVDQDTPERLETMQELTELLEGSAIDPDGDLARAVATCTCPPGRIDMTVGNLAARHRVCLFSEWVGRENSRLWDQWADGERQAHKELGQ